MSHSYDRTLVQALAMDPDRKSPAHDNAVVRLTTYPNEVVNIVLANADLKLVEVLNTRCELERVVTKGEGAFRAHIGFVDLVVHARVRCADADGRESNTDETVAVEVKTGPVLAGDLLRQVNLYRQYTPPSWRWACWSPRWSYNQQTIDAIREQRIVLLGDVA